jgi:hypothetical protein
MFKSNFQTRNKTRLCDKKQEHKNYEQKHETCKIKVKTNFCYTNICKHEHENNMTRLWCKIVLKICVKQTKIK